ncbi:hypothetical protein PMAYCL1PPCAC_28101, partial [Pristionchus mayeri]
MLLRRQRQLPLMTKLRPDNSLAHWRITSRSNASCQYSTCYMSNGRSFFPRMIIVEQAKEIRTALIAALDKQTGEERGGVTTSHFLG